MNDKVIFFVPVHEKYFSRWEYYRVDYEALTKIYSKVTVCTSLWQVVKNCRKTRLIYCWWWHRSAPVILLARILGIKTQVTGAIHMFDLSGAIDFYSKPFLYRLSAKLALNLADRNLFISRDQYLQVTSHLKVNNPIVVLSSLPDNMKFSKQDVLNRRGDRYNRQRDGAGLLFFTVVWHTIEQYHRKGIFETLYAFSLLKEKTEIEFTWVVAGGSGDGLSGLNSKIIELGLVENVEVRVDISQEEKRDLYAYSDLYIQPSWCEGFGNAVLEATSNGLPALVSRYTAQPEVVGKFGFVTMEMNAKNICEKIEEFVVMDNVARSMLECDILDYVEQHFTFEKRVESLINVSLEMGLSDIIVNKNLSEEYHDQEGGYTA